MATPTYDCVSDEYILSTAKMELNIMNSTLDDTLMKNYFVQAMKELRTPLMFEQKQAVLEINDYKAKLPCDFVRLNKQGGVVVGANGTAHPGYYPLAGGNAFFKNQPNSTFNFGCETFYQIVDGWIYFSNNSNIRAIMISYQGVRTDECGAYLIPSSHERTIVAYIKYKYAQTFYEKYPQSIRLEYKDEWTKCKRAMKGFYGLPSEDEKELISRRMNQIVLR